MYFEGIKCCYLKIKVSYCKFVRSNYKFLSKIMWVRDIKNVTLKKVITNNVNMGKTNRIKIHF